MGTSYKTMEQNTIRYMLQYVAEYEQVRDKQHGYYKHVREFFKDKGICFQNFYKFYSRYISSGRDGKALLPMRRGPKPKYQESPLVIDEMEQIILEYRSQGYNKLVIAECLKKDARIKKLAQPVRYIVS